MLLKPGDFIGIHAQDQTYIGQMISDEGDTITAKIGNDEWYNIPKNICELYVAVIA